MAIKNSTILEKAWLEGSNDFQQRIPNPSISGYQAAFDELFNPYNGQALNEFANLLVGLIGTYVESKKFENPLRELKKPATQWGDTERHIAVKYLKAHAPKLDDETLLKLEKPEFVEWFYKVNNNRRYEFSWNRFELERVFSNADAYGYDELLTSTLTAQLNSDNYDEMVSMIQAFAVADNNDNYKLYRSQVQEPLDKTSGQELLAKIKTDAGMMKFPSTRYNYIDVPVFENSSSLILWVTPQVDASLDVFALAELFNVDRAEVNFRKIVIPEFPIPNVYAALTSEDFIFCRDVWYGIEPPFYNPANRTYKYYLYHDQIIGVNPLANCILYTYNDTETPTITVDITGLETKQSAYKTSKVDGKWADVDLSDTFNLTGSVTGSNEGNIQVKPQAVTYDVTCATRELNSRTYVTNDGILKIQSSAKSGDVITVTATSTYINPTGTTNEYVSQPVEITLV